MGREGEGASRGIMFSTHGVGGHGENSVAQKAYSESVASYYPNGQ